MRFPPLALLAVWLPAGLVLAAPPAAVPVPGADTPRPPAGPAPGHSAHGQAFDEGPRQRAHLMPSQGNVSFPVTTKSPEAQKFFTQGVGQLHSFFYWEAERSFRQAAALDPDCAMAYWGMAMANAENARRSRAFIEKADKLKGDAGPREKRWIEALAAYRKTGSDEKTRLRAYIRDLEAIVLEYPDDLEAKAFLALTLWKANGLFPIISPVSVDSLITEVLRANPMHPGAHHYRIHLWDQFGPKNALGSTEKYGPSAAGIAHAWHMPGHIYDKLGRYADAAFALEASARVDHAYMTRNYVMPYQIHNYAHNNAWLIGTLSRLGRAHDAVESSESLIAVPRHPTQNRVENPGSSTRLGRAKLLEVLQLHERWDELIALAGTPYLEPTDIEEQKVRRLRALGVAHFAKGNVEQGRKTIAELEALAARAAPVDPKTLPPAAAAKVDFKRDVFPLLTNRCFECHQGSTATSGHRLDLRAELLNEKGGKAAVKAGDSGSSRLVHLVAGKVAGQTMPPKGEGLTPAQVGLLRAWIDQGVAWDDTLLPPDKSRTNQPAPEKPAPPKQPGSGRPSRPGRQGPPASAVTQSALAELKGHLALATGDIKSAQGYFTQAKDVPKESLASAYVRAGKPELALRLSAEAAVGNAPFQARAVRAEVLYRCGQLDEARKAFASLAEVAGYADADLPVLERLKPMAAALKLPTDWRKAPPPGPAGRPKLDTLGPLRWQPPLAPSLRLPDADGKLVGLDDYRGKPVVVIFYLGLGCMHCVEQLRKFGPAAPDYKKAGISIVAVGTESVADLRRGREAAGATAFPLLADPEFQAFRAWRAFDDFENQPLHATFLVDGHGRIRWQDIGPEPFGDAKFLLAEAQRLLALP